MAKKHRDEINEPKSVAIKETGARQITKANHPKYIDMIKDAIANLKQPRGTQTRYILDYICDNYKLENRKAANQSMIIALKTGVKNGYFKKAGRYAVKYIITNEEKTTVKKARLKKRSQAASSSVSKEEVTGSITYISRQENVKSKMTSSMYPHEQSTSNILSEEPSGPGMTFSCDQSSCSSPLPSLKTMTVRYKEQLNIKTPLDLFECSIVAMDVTADGRVLIIDHGNSKIKLFNASGQHLASLLIGMSPVDISAMDNTKAVVAFATETPLLCLNIEDCIEKEKNIKDTSNAMFISCCQNRIAVAFWEDQKSVKLIDMDGYIYWSRSLADIGHPLFKMPFYITMYQDKNRLKIFVYDRIVLKENRFIILNADDGSIVELLELSRPGEAGVINGSGGSSSICNYQMCNNTIYAWVSHYQSRKVLISETHGLGPYPRFIKYCEPTNEMFVGYSLLSERKKVIDIFSVFP